MTTDVEGDLHTPLMPRARLADLWPVWRDRLAVALWWFTRVGGGVLGLVFILLTGWVFLTDTPLGGEPQTQSPIQFAGSPNAPGAEGVDPSTPGMSDDADGLAQPLPPSQPDALAGGPRVLRVPQPDIAEAGEQDAAPPTDQLGGERATIQCAWRSFGCCQSEPGRAF